MNCHLLLILKQLTTHCADVFLQQIQVTDIQLFKVFVNNRYLLHCYAIK